MSLDNGADINAMKMDRWTPLHYASYFDFLDVTKVILDQGVTASVTNNERNDDGRTAFQVLLARCDSTNVTHHPDNG